MYTTYTIEPFEGGYVLQLSGAGKPTMWFATIKEAAIALCQEEYAAKRRAMHERISIGNATNED